MVTAGVEPGAGGNMRGDRQRLLLLMAVATAVYLACSGSLQVGQHVDDASYVMLAKSLLSGQGYRQIAYPDAPPETKYPPLMAVLIAPFMWVSGGALWAAKAPALLCAVVAIPVLGGVMRHFAEGWTLWMLLAVAALHPLVAGFAGMAMTEAPSLLITWGVLLLWLRMEEGARSAPAVNPEGAALAINPGGVNECGQGREPLGTGAASPLSPEGATEGPSGDDCAAPSGLRGEEGLPHQGLAPLARGCRPFGAERLGHTRHYLAVGLLVGLGMLLRTDLVAVGVAGVMWLLWRRRWGAALVTVAGAALPLIPWSVYLAQAGGGETYLHEASVAWWDPSPLPLRLWHSLVIYLGDYIPQVVTLVFGERVTALARAHGLGPVLVAMQWLVTAAIVVGAVRLRRQVPALILLFVLLRLGMLLGFARVTRYLLPMLPFLLAYLVAGLGMWGRPWRRCPAIPRAALVLGLLLALALARDGLLLVDPPRRDYPDVAAGGQLIRDHTPPGAVVQCNWSAKSFWLYAPDRLVLESETDPGRADFVLSLGPGKGPGVVAANLPPVPRAPLARSPGGKLVLERVLKRPANHPHGDNAAHDS